ncbi:MAG TPA: DNA repair protein RadA, partial [Pseudolysinimonas sp.]|nr:DNA repair protein RadA [Pseudolysinimonas sp.]
MARPASPGFACSECGWAGGKWYGQCPECQAWGSVVEKGVSAASVKPARVSAARAARPITDLGADTVAHWPSGIPEFDRVLGGGIVPGAAIL